MLSIIIKILSEIFIINEKLSKMKNPNEKKYFNKTFSCIHNKVF
jgi:hypothetical protein